MLGHFSANSVRVTKPYYCEPSRKNYRGHNFNTRIHYYLHDNFYNINKDTNITRLS